MPTGILQQDMEQAFTHKEGDLYKEVTVGGKTFQLRYGYYEPFERERWLDEPIPIYPNFIIDPLYTQEGVTFVTAMQDICAHYKGKKAGDSCAECEFFVQSRELFGFCKCSENKQVLK